MASFWERVTGAVAKGVLSVSQALPPCYICGRPGVQYCAECGRIACHIHAYTCVGSFQSACTPCMEKQFTWVQRTEQVEQPWDVLGVDRNADVETIHATYRERSKEAHPDHGGSHEEQSRLNAAYAELLRMRRAA